MTVPNTLVGETLFYSGVAWIPYSILLLYLFHEHNVRHRFPQNLVLLLLSIGSIIRCLWYLLYDPYGPGPIGIILNRMAILMQFSAVTVLLMMWSRALKITQNIDKINTINPSPMTAAERLQAIRIANEQSLVNLRNIRQQNRYMMLTIFLNVLVWAVILGSIALLKYDGWYNANLAMLSLLCLIAGLITLAVGIRTSLKLQNELKPVYQSNTILTNQYDATAARKPILTQKHYTCGCGLIALFRFIFSSSTSNQYRGLQMQREVLKTLLSVSIIVCFFFTIRAFGFIYHPLIEVQAHEYTGSYEINHMMFPLFLYTFPETLPTVAIAVGISPPSGIMRRYFMPLLARLFCMESCGIYNAALYNDNFTTPRDSLGSGNRSREGSFSNPLNKTIQEVDNDERSTFTDPAEKPEIVESKQEHQPQSNSSVAATSTAGKQTFSLFGYFARKTPDPDTRSESTIHSGGTIVKHSTIYGKSNHGLAGKNIHYEPEHVMFESDDLYSSEEQTNDSFSMQSTTTASLHSNRSSNNMQSFSISRPVVIDDARNRSTFSVTSPLFKGNQNVASSEESDFKIGSYGSGQSPGASSGGGWRTYSTEELSRFRQESEDYAELIYRVNSFGTNSRQDSQSTLGTATSALTLTTAGSGHVGDDEESQQSDGAPGTTGGRTKRAVHHMGFFGTLFRSKK